MTSKTGCTHRGGRKYVGNVTAAQLGKWCSGAMAILLRDSRPIWCKPTSTSAITSVQYRHGKFGIATNTLDWPILWLLRPVSGPILCRKLSISPARPEVAANAVTVVATVRSVKYNGGLPLDASITRDDRSDTLKPWRKVQRIWPATENVKSFGGTMAAIDHSRRTPKRTSGSKTSRDASQTEVVSVWANGGEVPQVCQETSRHAHEGKDPVQPMFTADTGCVAYRTHCHQDLWRRRCRLLLDSRKAAATT